MEVLQESEFKISHLGKSDPPRKWTGDVHDAAEMIITGSDLTNWTFMRDSGHKFSLHTEIHDDPRWAYSSISASMPDEAILGAFGKRLSSRIRTFAAIMGKSGAGKDQNWKVLHLSADCPSNLSAKFVDHLQPNQSTDPTLASGTPGARHQPRHP